jgi:hypothetical protein
MEWTCMLSRESPLMGLITRVRDYKISGNKPELKDEK